MKAPTVPRRDWTPPTRRRVLGLRDRLRGIYGVPVAPPHGAPVDELILTILSQSTNDRNRDNAYVSLRAALPAWEDVRDAPLADVERAIQVGGLHRQKSARIQDVLRALSADDGTIDLDDLAHKPVAVARAELTALPGVGRKTTACVLLFAFGMDDVPVDTHVSRVGTRLGLFRPGAPFEELHDDLLAMLRPGEGLEFHLNVLRHGRRTCHSQRPACGTCRLRRTCPRTGVS